MRQIIFYLTILIISLSSCQQVNPNWKADSENPEFLHRSMKKLSDVIVYDIFSPPVASRIYAYAAIAAYEAVRHQDSTYVSLEGQVSELENIPDIEKDQEYNFQLAGVIALLKVGKALIFSEPEIDTFQMEIMKEFDALHMPRDVKERSIAYGNEVADYMLEWANNDMYNETRSYPKYSVTDDPSMWKPTPPGYMDGIEPAWRDIRTLVIDSAQQFRPPFPTDYDVSQGSPFYEEVMEVYEAVNEAGEEETEIASFWDCNPYVLNVTGHVMHATKKITPGGHWIGIVGVACRKDKASFVKSAEAYALTSIALMDAFISCWDEKYRSNLTRPETVINENIDEDWVPILQTPPFPEYTSGHSVISGAAAIALTSIFGDNFEFADDVEVEYGLPVRKFKSFIHASDEAAISRLYGGIHYRPAIDNGVEQGRALGRFIVEHISMKQG